MPIAKIQAETIVALLKPDAIVPKATPIANPSGILCKVIASTSRIFLLQDEEIPRAYYDLYAYEA